ncbi:MAG: hypothetical protein A3J72_03400 [Nitrospirae bacterium RIFCSPHIGHO2_02_FULL_40_19]|nr:MAG: hypothetical protein A3J72_03400 [Nitrospirae bacterium RIFCSPHIGHO2_02_FULL_40_19]
MSSKRGLAGLAVVFAAMFVWIIIVTFWYQPASLLDLTDQTNMFITLWWTAICGICVFIGLRIEKGREV